MATIVMTTYTLRTGQAERFRTFLKEHSARLRSEQGCQWYHVYLPTKDRHEVVTLSQWVDSDALKAFLQSDYMVQRYQQKQKSVVVQDVVVRTLTELGEYAKPGTEGV